VGGIVVAVPVVIFYNYLVTKVNFILTKLENQVNGLVLMINASNGKTREGGPEAGER
jgi:biopolymer transport protein ExbB